MCNCHLHFDAQLERRWLACASGSREGSCTVGASSVDLVHVEERRIGVSDGHVDHSVVRELREESESGRLLAAALRASQVRAPEREMERAAWRFPFEFMLRQCCSCVSQFEISLPAICV